MAVSTHTALDTELRPRAVAATSSAHDFVGSSIQAVFTPVWPVFSSSSSVASE